MSLAVQKLVSRYLGTEGGARRKSWPSHHLHKVVSGNSWQPSQTLER